ncbi:MAG TPA: DUF58 domain-containing protein [Candidatus Limnocylindrales bacterium]|nr:DUF58 domain-containing protein [Candidatus Limnocylindrales bacterium]
MWPSNYIVKLTREGKIFSGLTLLIGIAAVNTGNNLLYLILGMMSSFIITSGLLSTLSLRKIQVQRTLPEHIYARKPFSVKVTLTNHKRLFPSFSLLVEDLSQEFSELPKAFFIKIPAKGEVTLRYTLVLGRRGLHSLKGLKVSTGYPFGLCLRARILDPKQKVLVYPKIESIHGLSDSPAFLEGEQEVDRRGMGTDFNGIREYTPGDSSRRIHWKTTAKSSRLMVREFEDESRRRATLIVDTSCPSEWEAEMGSQSLVQKLDDAVDMAASYAWHFLHQNFEVQLITPSETVSFNGGCVHLFKILRVLALLEPTHGQARARLLAAAQKLNGKGGLQILIGLDGKTSIFHSSGFIRGISSVRVDGHRPFQSIPIKDGP